MTDRWSNPSGGLGVQRFHVWPAGSDSYSHADLAANWDALDAILGIPSSGAAWPSSTGIDGGIYKEIQLAKNGGIGVGTVVSFFRPSTSVPIPTGWAVCDGSVLTSSEHAFPGISGNVTLPDLRNAFVLGADPTKSIGTAAAAVGTGNIDIAAGAPGPQAEGGSNEIIQTVDQMPAHTHPLNSTSSTGDFLRGDPTLPAQHSYGSFGWSFTGGPYGFQPISVSGSIGSTGNGDAMDNRPRWVGLIYICYVLPPTTI